MVDFESRIRAGMEAYRKLVETDGEIASTNLEADKATMDITDGRVGVRLRRESKGRAVDAVRIVELHSVGASSVHPPHEVMRVAGAGFPLRLTNPNGFEYPQDCEDLEAFENVLGEIFSKATTAVVLERLAGVPLRAVESAPTLLDVDDRF